MTTKRHDHLIGLGPSIDARASTLELERPHLGFHVHKFSDEESVVQALEEGSIDIAPISIHRLAHIASRVEVIPGMGIGSDGESGVLKLQTSRQLDQVETIRSSSERSFGADVCRVLFAASGTQVSFSSGNADADLLTDAAALPLARKDGLDLGTVWKTLTSRPLVRRVWVARPGAVDRAVYGTLHEGRTWSRLHQDEVVRALTDEFELQSERLVLFFENLRSLRLGRREVESIELFWQEMQRIGLLETVPSLVFVPLSAGTSCADLANTLRKGKSALNDAN